MVLDKRYMNMYLVFTVIALFLAFMVVTAIWIVNDINKNAIIDIPVKTEKVK